MPPSVPEKFSIEPQYTLWRDIARLQENYTSSTESFVAVLDDITSCLKTPQIEVGWPKVTRRSNSSI